MTALAKFCLLFVGGVTVGLVIPWGFGPSKPASRPEEAGRAGDRQMTLRCIVEYRREAPAGKGAFKRALPRPEELQPEDAAARPVEIVVQPGGQRVPVGEADDVTVIFRLKPGANSPEAVAVPPERSMPGAM